MKTVGGILASILGTIAIVLLAGRGGATKLEESADALSVSASGYSQRVAYATIDSVTLRHGLDGLQARRNALQSGNTYVGRFAMRPYGEAMLFVDALKEPLVVIHASNGVTILSAADSIKAEDLAARLRSAASRDRHAR